MKKALDHLIRSIETLQDDLIRALLTRVIPTWMQHKLRDSGFFQIMSDFGFFSAAVLIGIFRPSLVIEYAKDLYRCKRVLYGETAQHFALTLSFPLQPALVQPIVVFVHGGAWGSGRPWQYLMVAKRFASIVRACHVAVVGYPVYPQASILQQRDAILQAVQYFKHQHADTSAQPIVLVGHSSGANVALLAVMDPAHQHQVQAFFGLSGVYDINSHYLFESNRGVQHISPMAAAAGGEDGFDNCSPHKVLERRLSSKRSFNLDDPFLEEGPMNLPTCMFFLHGTKDTVVPVSSTMQVVGLIQQYGKNVSCHCPQVFTSLLLL